MADFIIPQGKEFKFTIKVIEKDSFLAQDVKSFDDVHSSIQFRSYTTQSCVVQNAGEVTMTKIADSGSFPATYLNGYIEVVLSAAYTTRMVPRRGDLVDGLYLKPAYEAIFTIAFTDPTVNTRTVLVDNIYAVPASC